MSNLSIVIPARNEAENIIALVNGIDAALASLAPFEIIVVDDGSTDNSVAVLTERALSMPHLRIIRHDQSAGQSAGVHSGVLAARSPIICTLDGDGQNPPEDAPKLADMLIAAPPQVALVGGVRQKRQDSQAKLWASRWANRIRKRLLGDDADDTGCGLKAFRRDVFLRLPYFDHVHRYLPALVIREGYENRYLPIGHRHRETGQSKYTNWGRLKNSFSDLLGVMWLKTRSRRPGGISEF